MDEITPLKALDDWIKSDGIDVEDYNRSFPYSQPPLETQVAFLRHRLNKALGCMALIMRLTIERDAHSALPVGDKQ